MLGNEYRMEAPLLFQKAFGVSLRGYPEKVKPFVKNGVDWHPFALDMSHTLASFERLTGADGCFNNDECFIELLSESKFAASIEFS